MPAPRDRPLALPGASLFLTAMRDLSILRSRRFLSREDSGFYGIFRLRFTAGRSQVFLRWIAEALCFRSVASRSCRRTDTRGGLHSATPIGPKSLNRRFTQVRRSRRTGKNRVALLGTEAALPQGLCDGCSTQSRFAYRIRFSLTLLIFNVFPFIVGALGLYLPLIW